MKLKLVKIVLKILHILFQVLRKVIRNVDINVKYKENDWLYISAP